MNLLNPSNPDNPQDLWGVQHNQVISEVLTSSSSQFAQITDPHAKQQAIVSAVQQAGSNMFGYNEDPYAYFTVLPGYTGLLQDVNFDDSTAIIDCFPDHLPWLRDKLKDLFNLLKTMPLNTEGEVNQALITIRNFENQVIAEGNAEPALLATIAITKYSLYGWFTLPNIPEVQASINWGGVLCDAAGALAGGIIIAAAASTVYKCCTE